MNQNKIGKLIAECRKEKNLTQKELAEILRVSNKTVSKWECGTCLPDVSMYKEICEILGITLNEFFAGEKIEEKEFKKVADNNLLIVIKKGLKHKKLFIISLILLTIISLFVIFINTREEQYLGSSYTILEAEDGWYYELVMNYSTQNKAEHIISRQNYKYIEDCELKDIEKIKENTIEINSCVPNYVFQEDEEALRISKYFNRKQFNREITEKDLKGLKTEVYDKKMLVEIYNKAIIEKVDDSIKIKLDLHTHESRNDIEKDGYKVNIGIAAGRTGILIFRIDLEYIDGSYLSDLVENNKATEEQIEIYNNLKIISEEFINTQDTHIRDEFNLEDEVYDRVFSVIESIKEYEY